jgi:SanA protein
LVNKGVVNHFKKIKRQTENHLMKKKILIWTIITGLILSLIFILIANHRINKQTGNQVFNSIDSIPENKVGLLLGTSKYLKSGKSNQYFEYRISAAEKLFKSGKVKYIVISGDNSTDSYNEPQDMKDELIKRGIPGNKIYLDYAGFRTYDSVYRLKEIFGQENFTIISQEFHNRRAVYIANSLHLNAVGFNARDVDDYNGFKTKVRELFARVKVIIDITFNKKPKFLGEKITIE